MEFRKNPPRILERLLLYILPRYVGHTALGDFAEEYNRVANIRGDGPANLWYLFQIMKSVPPFISNAIRWGFIMFRNYMKVTLRTIRRHKGFSFINIVGLAVGMACVVIILLWVQYELSFDKHHENAERIFRIASESHAYPPPTKTVVSPPPMAPALAQEFPEIEASARLSRGGRNKLFSYQDKHFYESYFAVDPDFFEIFTFDFVEGEAGTALNDPYSIVLSEDQARKFFGSRNPIGQVIKFDEKTDFSVTGIIKNIPSNSHLTRDIFIPFETWGKLYEEPLHHWGYWSFYTYILTRPNVNNEEIETKFPAFAEKHGIPEQKLFLQPLLSIHLHSHFQGEISSNTYVSTLLLFGTIAILILIIACINYMNLTTARASARLKEVGTRKVVGAHRSQIARQFLGESLIMTLFSLIISLFLVHLFLPLFNSLAERHLALSGDSILRILPGILLLVLFVGMLGGSYPALLLSSFKPITVFRGGGRKGSQKRRLRNVLVVAQFSVSLIQVSEVSYDFTELYGIKILNGRSFSREFPSDENGAFLVNESAKKIMGDDFRLGIGLSHWGRPDPSGQIVGVMKDYHLNSIHEEIQPLYIYLNPNRGQHLSIKIQGGRIPETIGFVQKTMEKFSPYYPFEYRFFDDIFNMAYVEEQKMGNMFGVFASIAVFIACMGVFGLSAFLAEQKRKEIGIRKVLGASVSKIVYMIARDLMWIILFANIIGWPVAYYAMNRWLQNFAYRTDIHVWLFFLSSILIFLVSFVTLSYQAIKAARANPVDSLRYE